MLGSHPGSGSNAKYVFERSVGWCKNTTTSSLNNYFIIPTHCTRQITQIAKVCAQDRVFEKHKTKNPHKKTHTKKAQKSTNFRPVQCWQLDQASVKCSSRFRALSLFFLCFVCFFLVLFFRFFITTLANITRRIFFLSHRIYGHEINPSSSETK